MTAEVRDSTGLTARVTRDLMPRTVPLTFTTSPAGGTVVLEGTTRRTPLTVTAWVGQHAEVSAPDQTLGATPYAFSAWSDGGARTHIITAPATAATWTARFVPR